MAGNYTRLSDTLTSSEGSAFITRDGQNRPMFELSSIKANIELKIIARRMLGHRMTQHKVIGGEGKGSCTLYLMNSDHLRAAQEYIKNGRMENISIQLRNVDNQSTVGTQDVTLRNVVFSTLPITSLDDQSEDPITIETEFTFDDMDVLEMFKTPENYR